MENRITLTKDRALHYGDFRITTCEENGKEFLKITTDIGNLIEKPQTNNSIIIESDKSRYKRRKRKQSPQRQVSYKLVSTLKNKRCITKQIVRTETELNNILDECHSEVEQCISKFTGMSYEEGVIAGIRWLLEDTEEHPMVK